MTRTVLTNAMALLTIACTNAHTPYAPCRFGTCSVSEQCALSALYGMVCLESCAADPRACAPEEECRPAPVEQVQVCVPTDLRRVGEFCETLDDCAPGLECAGLYGHAHGQCAVRCRADRARWPVDDSGCPDGQLCTERGECWGPTCNPRDPADPALHCFSLFVPQICAYRECVPLEFAARCPDGSVCPARTVCDAAGSCTPQPTLCGMDGTCLLPAEAAERYPRPAS